MDASDAETSVQTQTASADQQPQASQPQRSRTTVVCGECKRLKLKCDRNQPCSNCAKRRAIEKCLYPAGAAEKLDIHSLHNRLMHVEAFTTTYTNGRFQPALASANHPSSQAVHPHMPNHASQLAQQHPGWYHHQHHHHPGIMDYSIMAETFSKSFQSLIQTCLGDLGILQNPLSSTRGDIKLEPSLMGPSFEQYSGLLLDSPSSNSKRMSKLQLRQHLRVNRASAHDMLPSINVYLSTAPSTPQNSIPQVTSALLSCLPPLPTCQRLLQCAGDVFRVRPLPFDPLYGSGHGWKSLEKRCLQFLSGFGKDKEARRLTPAAKRAREIYFAGSSQLLSNEPILPDVGSYGVSPPNEGDGGHHSSLTFFAITCAALAIGAVSSSSEGDSALGSSRAEFFYALAQQALGIWDTQMPSPSKQSKSKNDAEQMEYLFACLLSVVYLLRSGTIAAASGHEVGDEVQEDDVEIVALGEEDDDDARISSSLVGKMVTVARNMHLDKETTWTKKKKKKCSNRDRLRDEWKRMIWWEIVFYDLFIADALGQQPLISLGHCSTNFPSCAMFLQPPRSEDESHSSDQGRLVQNEALPHRNQSTTGTVETSDEEAYFGARYQLARVAQAVKSRNSLPDCCCGYTLDQAVALENEVREWQDALPASLKISGDDETESTTTSTENILRRLQAYELAIISNVLAVNVYMPFLRADADGGTKSRFKNLPAATACIHAAQAIIHLTDRLQPLLSHPSISFLFSSKVMPMMFEFIPLEKLVFNSVVLCAHAAFAVKPPSMMFGLGTMAEDASLGLQVLQKLQPLFSSTVERDGDNEFQSRVMNILHVRLVQRDTSLKRKFDEPTSGAGPQNFNPSLSNGPAVPLTLEHQPLHISQQGPPTQHTFIMDSFSSPSSNLDTDYSGSQSPSSVRQPRRSNTGQKNLNKEKGKKGKKREKGGTGEKQHPTLGMRQREANSAHSAPAPRSNRPGLTKALGAWKFEQKLQVQMDQCPSHLSPSTDGQGMPTISPIASSGGSFTSPGHRSRSSSTTHVHPPSVDALRFTTPLTQSPDEIGMPPRKRPALHHVRKQELQPRPTSFVPPTFDQGHRQAQHDPNYDHLMSTTTFAGPSARTIDAATYSVAPVTQSSYISVPDHSATSAYGPHLSLSSVAQPTTYFPSATSYGPTFVEHPPSNLITLHAPVSGSSVNSQPPMISVPSTPVYEHGSQQQPIENYPSHSQVLHQHQMQSHPVVSNPYHGPLMSDQSQPSVAMYDSCMGNSTVTGILRW